MSAIQARPAAVFLPAPEFDPEEKQQISIKPRYNLFVFYSLPDL